MQAIRDALTEEVTSLGRRNTELEALAKAVPLLRDQVHYAALYYGMVWYGTLSGIIILQHTLSCCQRMFILFQLYILCLFGSYCCK